MKAANFILIGTLFIPVMLAGFLFEMVVLWFGVGQLAARDVADWIRKI